MIRRPLRPMAAPDAPTRAGSHGAPPVLRPDEHRLLRDLFAERLGLQFAAGARASLERRLRERLVIHGLSSFADYHRLLRFDPRGESEWDEASELLTTHETYFFREEFQLRAFKTELLPALAERARQRRRLHLWSAGCSTGEEAYTIAILVLESGLFEGWDIRVFGSDLSKRCIATARHGVYGPTSFRATAPDVKARWFSAVEGGLYAVCPEVKALCHFGRINLLDDERVRLVAACDAIFCRNVLFYLHEEARKHVIETFYERLHPGGALLLGHAESLLNVSTAFELVHLTEDLVYGRPLG